MLRTIASPAMSHETWSAALLTIEISVYVSTLHASLLFPMCTRSRMLRVTFRINERHGTLEVFLARAGGQAQSIDLRQSRRKSGGKEGRNVLVRSVQRAVFGLVRMLEILPSRGQKE